MLGSGGVAPGAVRCTAQCLLELDHSRTGAVKQKSVGDVATTSSLAFEGRAGGELMSGSQSLVTGSILVAVQSWQVAVVGYCVAIAAARTAQ
jgi:hypothetical protein